MVEPPVVVAAVAAGSLCGTAVLVAGRRLRLDGAAERIRRFRPQQALVAWRWLSAEIARAGWRESPERVAAITVIVGGGLGALGLTASLAMPATTSAALALFGAAGGVAAMFFSLESAVARRRRRLARELAPLLELFVLELGGGGSPASALGSVTMQLDGELASELRRLLIASHVAGSASFEARLRDYADRLRLPALGSLATILTASREYGTGVTQGIRALAADLRRDQRRELIAHSRRALNHVLFPAAIGVLLPFLAILLFPAVTSLQRNLR